MRLSIFICATRLYSYAVRLQAHKIQAAISYLPRDTISKGLMVLVGDQEELGNLKTLYESLLPGWEIRHIIAEVPDGLKNYEQSAQRLIAQMRTAGFTASRAWGADYTLSMDSDVLPPPNSIQCMLDTLSWDQGYYSVAACPYPSQGGGPFLGGFGSTENPIFPNFYPEELEVPERYLKYKERLEKQFESPPNAQWIEKSAKKLSWIRKRLDKHGPKGNVFLLNGKYGWKPRGWLDYAYPAIGKGSLVPVNWVGFGCTLINREALACTTFDGYLGHGTEDLFICYHKWLPANLNIAVIPHCPCDHVIRQRSANSKNQEHGKYLHIQGYHESAGPMCGHLRQRTIPFFEHTLGESLIPETVITKVAHTTS
jgi:hypothetical protein